MSKDINRNHHYNLINMNIAATIFKPFTPDYNDDTTVKTKFSFFSFIWKEKINRLFLLMALAGTTLQFIIFKQYYPYPDFFSDSYSYLFAAHANLDVSIWPIGYSKFLRWFHFLTYSSTALTAFQYFLVELGALYFFFTFLFLFNPVKKASITLFLFLFFNPLFLYISNYVNSDPLFASLSLIWFTQLLWILHKPRIYHLFLQGIILFLCFTVRNNAYYYPIIAAIVFILSRQSWKLKLSGILWPFLFIIPFIIHTRNAAYKMTGFKQYSLFTGWQLANNALYMRGHITVDSNQLPSKGSRILNNIAEIYFHNRAPEFDEYLSAYVANYFIRQPNAPLKEFFSTYFNPTDDYEIIIAWAQASIIFEQYGSYLIKKYPLKFTQYFLWPNTKNFFISPLEKLEIYNLGQDEVNAIAQTWFNFKSTSITSFSKEVQGKILFLYPMIFLFINLYFLINLYIWFKKFKVRHITPSYTPYLLLASSYWVLNFGFSVFATMNVLRYQFTPMIFCLGFTLLLMNILHTKESKPISTTYAIQH